MIGIITALALVTYVIYFIYEYNKVEVEEPEKLRYLSFREIIEVRNALRVKMDGILFKDV